MAQFLAIQVLSCRLGSHLGRHFGNFNFWHRVLCLQFKFEPNRFINGWVIGNLSFEPPFCPPFWPPFWNFLVLIVWRLILRLQFKFESNRFINGWVMGNNSNIIHQFGRHFGKKIVWYSRLSNGTRSGQDLSNGPKLSQFCPVELELWLLIIIV